MDDVEILKALEHLAEAEKILRSVLRDRRDDEIEDELSDEAFLDLSLNKIDFGPLTLRLRYNLFERGGRDVVDGAYPINTVRDLISYTPEEILRRPNVGRLCLQAVQAKLAEHGLMLKSNAWERTT